MNQKKDNKPIIYIIGTFVYLFLILVSIHSGYFSHTMDKQDISMLFTGLSDCLDQPFAHILPIYKETGTYFVVITVIFLFIMLWLITEEEKYQMMMINKEKGTTHWFSDYKKFRKKYSYPPKKDTVSEPTEEEKFKKHEPGNMILTKNVLMNMNTRITRKNNNVLVIGGSGKGKSRFFVKPNILQANCSYVITDPSGELLESTGTFLEEQGYEIKVFNLCDMEHSSCYNPFCYMRDDAGVMMLINCLIKNTTPEGKNSGDPFWEKSEEALLQALIFYLKDYCPKNQQNFSSVMALLREATVDEKNPDAKSPLDLRFEQVERVDPTSIAVKQYKIFKQGAGKTLKSILISTSVRLSHFNIPAVANLTNTDTLDLGSMGDRKQALFVIIPAADDTYNYLVSMMYYQLFETLYHHAEHDCKGKRLPVHVRFILDEFANIGEIPQFPQKLSTMRKYEISCSIILQSIAQLKKMYKDEYEVLMGNCDSTLFLGSPESTQLEYFSKLLGTRTILTRNSSKNYGPKSNSSQSFNKDQRELAKTDELFRLDDEECILIIAGLEPFYDKKYDYTKHPRYKLTADADDSKIYDYRKHFNASFSEIEIQETTRKKQLPSKKEKQTDDFKTEKGNISLTQISATDFVKETTGIEIDLSKEDETELLTEEVREKMKEVMEEPEIEYAENYEMPDEPFDFEDGLENLEDMEIEITTTKKQ